MGDNATCETVDQRGVARPQGEHCDIGAYEYQDLIEPLATSITRASSSPTSASTVNFTVTFSETVQNVDVGDFTLTKTGAIIGESIASVTPVSGSVYTVSVNTGSGGGTLRLDLPNSASIEDMSGNSLTGLPFISGESYTKVETALLYSAGANDGWILESTETSLTGGSLDSTATTFLLGDDAQDRQYRAILHFDTSSLPDNAVITSAVLMLRRHSTVGSNPFTTLGSLRVDLRKVSFGTSALQLTDFRIAANKNNVATFGAPVSNWYSGTLSAIGNAFINRTGSTQFKLYFTTDDNDDLGADFMRFFSGNAGAASRPRLVIQYYLP